MNAQTVKNRNGGHYGPFLGYKPETSKYLQKDDCWPPTRQQKLSGRELRRLLKCTASDTNSRVVKYLFDSLVEYLFHAPHPREYHVKKISKTP